MNECRTLAHQGVAKSPTLKTMRGKSATIYSIFCVSQEATTSFSSSSLELASLCHPLMQKLGGGVATAPEMQMKVPFFLNLLCQAAEQREKEWRARCINMQIQPQIREER